MDGEKTTMALALSAAIRSFCLSSEAFPDGDCSQVVCSESSSTATLVEEEEEKKMRGRNVQG